MQIKKYFAIDKKRCQTAFLSAVIIGLLVHFYRFTNLLPNHDAIWNFYSSQNMLKSGRWFLGIACGLSTYFDLPWVIGLVSLVYMGVTAAVIAEIFQMRSPFAIGLCSGLLVSFPAITATMGYEFTADGYMLAMALAALSVYLSRFVYLDGKQSLPFVLSGVCLCLTMAIYQAYVCFAFVLALCYCIVELLENCWDNKHLLKWIFIQIAVYICAFIAYSVIWEALLAIQGVEKVHYNGIDELGFVGFGGILRALWSILYSFVRYFITYNFLLRGFTTWTLLGLLFLLAAAGVLVAAIKKSDIAKRRFPFFVLILCVLFLPIGCFALYLVSKGVFYHALMMQSIAVIYITVAVVAARWLGCGKKIRWKNAVFALLLAVAFYNSMYASIYYGYMQMAFLRTQSAATEISTRIHLLDDGTIKYVAFYGKLDPWEGKNQFYPVEIAQMSGIMPLDRNMLSPYFLLTYTDFSLSWYRSNAVEYPAVESDPILPVPDDWEYQFPLLPAAEREALQQTQAVMDMPIWPARDSIQVIGETVVVKLS